MNARRTSQSGFTLIELLVVIIILGVLAAFAYPAYASVVRRARYAEAKQTMSAIAKEVKIYQATQGHYPPDTAPGVQPEGVENWPATASIPYESKYDYDRWEVGGGQCYVQIGYFGEDGSQDYPVHKINKKKPGFAEFDDSLILAVDVYGCS